MRKTIPLVAVLFVGLTSSAFAQNATWADAKWIWDEPDANKNAQTNDPRYLRLSFNLDAKPQAAELWITVDNVYVAYVNGQKVGTDAEWSTVEKYDVAKHLVVGKNVLAIQATNQDGVAGAIARLHIKTADKKDLFVVTDEKTKIQRAATVRERAPDWLKADFDDSNWFAAMVLGDPSIAPWNLTGSKIAKGGKPGGDRFGYGSNAVDPKVKTRLTAQEQLKHFLVPKDFAIELVAADPVVINPITMVLDDKGRIIVSESHTYRYGPPGSPIKPFANPVVRLDPDGKGGFTRTLIADGFADPVMGIAIKGDKLWLSACQFLYTYDIPDAPPEKGKPLATNKKLLLQDKSKAWNPFGMFVLEWGPDGKLYLSVGNHNIDITGNDGSRVTSRGGSGVVMRMNPDGTKLERLVHGLRVPYSFEYDPFGQLWLLSNGEGNPDRFVRVIEGVDYHCYSRPGIDNEWLAGRHPLAPPCEEVHGGAHTQLMRYYAANFPQEYQGNLFCCNWGRHGFAGANRGIFRFVLDERNNVVKKDTLVACTDPHFRPSHIHLDVDGSLLIADWYGRDDESDMTGRIWRLKYIGKDRPVVKHKLDAAEWKNDDYAISALGSPDHLIRQKAVAELAIRAPIAKFGGRSHSEENPMVAANVIWAASQVKDTKSRAVIAAWAFHSDWRVRRLALNVMRRNGIESRLLTLVDLSPEPEPAARLEQVLTLPDPGGPGVTSRLVELLESPGAAKDGHLRYEAAWHLANAADEKAITKLLSSNDANVRLAGLIAIDVACYENFPTKKIALEALAKALENPGKLDQQLLLTVAQLDGDASIVPALEKLIARDDLPTATIAKAVLMLKAKAGANHLLALRAQENARKRVIEAVEKGSLKIASPADQLVIFEFLESEGPTPFALKQISGQLQSNNKELKLAAHTLARRFGPKADSLAANLWPGVLNPKTKFEDAIESLSTIARIEKAPSKESWEKLLHHDDPFVRMEAVRWWRNFKGNKELVDVLVRFSYALLSRDRKMADDMATVLRELGLQNAVKHDKGDLAAYAVKELADMPAADRPKRAAMGQQVFERNACTKCHTTATQTTLLAPSLQGVAKQSVEHLIESVLYPSKIIRTGWEVEVVELKSGKVLTGLVKDDGKFLRILNLDTDQRILKTDIESRATAKTSVMPEGQEATLSRREFVDLIAYLQTLK
jgi:putative membrane-bound dehydrogenase-like protein